MITRKSPENVQRHYIPIVRPTASMPVEAYPLADEHEIFIVHRNVGRTVPCAGPGCLLCDAMMVREDRIFLPIWSVGVTGLAILDLPAAHHETLTGLANGFHGLRNTKLLVMRMRPQDNAPILIKSRPLKSGERARDAFVGLHEQLDAIFAQNVAFAMLDVQCQDRKARRSPVLNERQPT